MDSSGLHSVSSLATTRDAWQGLLALRAYVKAHPRPLHGLCLWWIDEPVVVADELPPAGEALCIGLPWGAWKSSELPLVQWNGAFGVEMNHAARQWEEITFFTQYLPYVLMGWLAETTGRCLSVAHFAQSLDGKIATAQGHSRWIGNEFNLVHAHRMRALCDGIVIGNGTLRADQPSLTVRHVEGPNPRRIVLSSSPPDLACLLERSPEPVWWADLSGQAQSYPQAIRLDPSPEAEKHICEQLLCLLHQQGINTVYVEGGSATTSAFLGCGMVDVLQLHLSPMVFGSGLAGICLPEIGEVGEAIQFEEWVFQPAGDAVMFVGKPKRYA